MSAAAGSHGASSPLIGAAPGQLIRGRNSDALTTTPVETPMQKAYRSFRDNRVAMVALVGLVMIFAVALFAPVISSSWSHRSATEQNLDGYATIGGKKVEVVNLQGMPNIGPGFRRTYTFGADALGRDVFVRAVVGASVSLRVGLGATILVIFFGTLLGLVQGFYGGRVDKFLSYVVDVMIAFPFMLFAIAFSAAIATTGRIGPISATSIWVPTLMLGLLGAFGFSRLMRSTVLELAEKEYVEAARALGADDKRIMFKHLVPHLVPTIITYFGLLLAGMILGEAGLSFLGVGVAAPTPSWGNLISDGKDYYATAWWIAAAGGIGVMATVLCANLVGEGLEEALDPKGTR